MCKARKQHNIDPAWAKRYDGYDTIATFLKKHRFNSKNKNKVSVFASKAITGVTIVCMVITGAELARSGYMFVKQANAIRVQNLAKIDIDAVPEVKEIATSVDDAANAKVIEGGTDSLFNIDEIRPKLKTEPNTAFFWSGRTDGVGGAENAATIAKTRGGVTLESTIESKNIVMPEWDFSNPSTMEAWDLASGAYAEQASGEIRAVIGAELRSGNIWENVELPRLMNNQKVTKITIIDPKTGIEKIIFER